MNWHESWMVFSDLDGTLLDHETYSWEPAAAEIERLARHRIPLILSSSKTDAEMRQLSHAMNLRQPMIIENGGAIAWPDTQDGYTIEKIGRPREEIVAHAHNLRDRHGYRFSGFSDWQADDLATHAGLDPETAALSLDRHATEPILWHDSDERFTAFAAALASHGIRTIRGGRFIHLMGEFDKVTGMRRIAARIADPSGRAWKSIALGDSPNDAAMLEAADVAVHIRSPESSDLRIHSPCLVQPACPGPHGWAHAMRWWWDSHGTMNPKHLHNHG